MLYFLTILVLLSAITVAAAATVTVLILRRRQKSLPPPATENPAQFQPPIQYQSIFAPSEEELRAAATEAKAKQREMLRQKILAKAETEDFAALIEAKAFENEFYERILKELTLHCDSKKFDSLCAFTEENKLPTNAEFIRRFRSDRENSLSRKDVIRLLHFAALSRSAEVFSATLEDALKVSKDFTHRDLIQLAESQFWLLPQAEKTSGAGFLLKQKLARLRAEVQEK